MKSSSLRVPAKPPPATLQLLCNAEVESADEYSSEKDCEFLEELLRRSILCLDFNLNHFQKKHFPPRKKLILNRFFQISDLKIK